MGAAAGRKDSDVTGQLFQGAYRFDFFQAVRLLEQLFRERARDDARWMRQPVGYDHPPEREVVRFRAVPALSFPAGDVARLQWPGPRQGGRERNLPLPELQVSFLGLTGPAGVLPQHYTALLLRRVRDKDFSLRDFLDLFNHRIISLFYRAREKYRLPFAYERSKAEGSESTPSARAIYCLAGFGTAGLLGRLAVDDEAFLYYSGHLAHVPRSALALECLLRDYFDLRIAVHQLQEQFLYLSPDDCSYLPSDEYPEGRNNELGLTTVVGDRSRDVQGKFRLRVGPLTYSRFRSLMPDGDALRPLVQMTRTFVGLELNFDMQLVLWPEEVPWCQLGAASDPAYLGWNAWIRSEPFKQEVDDAVFEAGDV
jgi:type VI secretion system protein ImpH